MGIVSPPLYMRSVSERSESGLSSHTDRTFHNGTKMRSCPKRRCQHDKRDGDEQLIFLPLQFSGRNRTCCQSLLDEAGLSLTAKGTIGIFSEAV